jgi:hypothetical protein
MKVGVSLLLQIYENMMKGTIVIGWFIVSNV